METVLPFSLLSAFLFLFFLFLLLKEVRRSKKLPPGPWKLPVIGNLHHIGGPYPHVALANLAAKHGPLMHLKLGERSAIVVSSPRLAKEVLKTHDLCFANRPELLVAKIMFYDFMDIGFSPYGDYWRQIRKICVTEILSHKRVQSFSYLMEDQVSLMVNSIKSSLEAPINVSEAVYFTINSIICRASVGRTLKEHSSLMKLMTEVASFAGVFNFADIFPSLKILHFIAGSKRKMMKMHKTVDHMLEDIIHEHEKNKVSSIEEKDETGEEDLVDILLKLKENNQLSMNSVKAVILDMFVAGTATSSVVVEWAMSEMVKNPRIMEKAQTEVRQGLEGKTVIRESDLQALTYLRSIIKETMRLHPSGPLSIPRECREDCQIDGYNIVTKTIAIINVWAIGRDAEYWSDPEKFIPERFDNSSSDFSGNTFEFIPFGAGRRICPGITFSLASIQLILAKLLYHFDWKLPGGISPEELDMSEKVGNVAARKTSLRLLASPHVTN